MTSKNRRKSWQEKLNDSRPHEVKPVPKDMVGMKKGQAMLIATPRIVADYVRKIPRGEMRDMPRMRGDLAKAYKAEVTCPITTGIFLRIVAEAACEDMQAGVDLEKVVPFWRVMDEKSPVAKKLACGSAFIAKRRAQEVAEKR